MKFILSVLVTLVLLLCPHAEVILNTTVGKAILYERSLGSESREFGSGSSLLRGPLEAYSPSRAPTQYKGVNVYIHCREEVDKASFKTLLTSGIRGLVMCTSSGSKNDLALSQVLGSSFTRAPVFGIPEGNETAVLEASLNASKLVASAGASAALTSAVPTPTLTSHRLLSSITHHPKEAKGQEGTTIKVLISSHFDSLGIFPSLPTTGGCSGNVAAVELFRRLVSNQVEQLDSSAYELFFLMGTTARLNYAGTSIWLSERNEKDLDSYQLFISLDELLEDSPVKGERTTLYMHVQDTFKKRADGGALIELAKSVAEAAGIDLKVQAAKTNYQHYDVRFEHEVFANRQLPAVTFSSRRSPQTDQLFRDGNPEINEASVAAFEQRISFIQKYIGAVAGIADEKNPVTFPGTVSYLTGLLQHASRAHRSPLVSNGTALSAYTDVVESYVRRWTRRSTSGGPSVSTKRQEVKMTPSVLFYGPHEQRLLVYPTKSLVMELFYSVVIVSVVLLFSWLELGVINIPKLVFTKGSEQ